MNKHGLNGLNGFRCLLLILLTILLAALASPAAGHPAPVPPTAPAGQTPAAPANGTGYFPSIAIGSDGLAVITYFDENALTLKVAHCGNAACSRDITSTTVISLSVPAEFFSMAVGADGLPMFSYLDDTSALMIAHCGNLDCTAGNSFAQVDIDAVNHSIGVNTLAIGADGLPIIAYNRDYGGLHVAHCGNAGCSAGNTITVINNPVDVGYGGYKIAVGADGLPIISLFQTSSPHLQLGVLHCGDVACSAGNTVSLVDEMFDGSSSIAIGADGLPVIAYLGINAILKVAHCGDNACTGSSTTTLAPEAFYPGIAVGSDELPIISYRASLAQMKVIHCGNAACTSGNTTNIIDKEGDRELSIVIGADGLPIIGYNGLTYGASLKAAHCANPACDGGAAVTVLDFGGKPMQWGFLPMTVKGPSATTRVVLDYPVENSIQPNVAIGTDSLPILSYYDALTNGVKVAHCGTVNCTGGNIITSVADSATSPSIAIGADGLPVIAYNDFSSGILRLYHCGNFDCTAGNTTLPVNASGKARILMGSDGLPLLHYNYEYGYPDTRHKLQIIHCGDATCSSGNQFTEFVDNSGYWVAIGSDGFPVIVIMAYNNPEHRTSDLSIIHCQDVACASRSTAVLLPDIPEHGGEGNIGRIAIGADGLPVIGYMDNPNRGFKLFHCGDIPCTNGNTTTVLDSMYPFTDIAIGSDGLPMITYLGSAYELKTLHCGDAACTGGNTISTLDTNGGSGAELAIGADGLPLLSYIYGWTSELTIVHCGDVSCSTYLPGP